MQRRTPLFIIASARPRAGKTMIARALVEFFCAQDRPVAAFDVNPGDHVLRDRLPAYTAPASLLDTRGEVALFDRLVIGDQVPKVVDLGHLMLERFFAVMEEVDVAGETRRRGIAPMVLFIVDGDERSRWSYSMLGNCFPDLPLVPVINESIGQPARYRPLFPPTRRGGEAISIPALTPVVRSVVEKPNFSFVSYAMRTVDTTSELYSWMRRVFISFRDLEVRLLLGELQQPQLRRSA